MIGHPHIDEPTLTGCLKKWDHLRAHDTVGHVLRFYRTLSELVVSIHF